MPRRPALTVLSLCLAAGTAVADTGAQWLTLGTAGGPAVQPGAAQIANALLTGDDIYLFDVGDGVRRQMARAGLAPARVRAVFLSHHHIDHTADLGPLLVANWLFSPQNRITVLGPAGTSTLVDGLVAAYEPTVVASFPVAGPAKPPLASTMETRKLPDDMDAPREVYADDRIRVIAVTVDHFQVPPSVDQREMPQAVAFRIEAGGRSIVYTGDTGRSARLERLARDADLLVSEVIDIDAMAALLRQSMRDAPPAAVAALLDSLGRNHLSPAYIGELAAEAGVGKVVLTHFVPLPGGSAQRQAWIDAVRSRFDGEVSVAQDLDRF